MPFKSRAQRRKFAELLVEGKISAETFEEWNRETGRRELPERIKPGSRKGTRTRRKKSTRPSRKTRTTKKAGATKPRRPKRAAAKR